MTLEQEMKGSKRSEHQKGLNQVETLNFCQIPCSKLFSYCLYFLCAFLIICVLCEFPLFFEGISFIVLYFAYSMHFWLLAQFRSHLRQRVYSLLMVLIFRVILSLSYTLSHVLPLFFLFFGIIDLATSFSVFCYHKWCNHAKFFIFVALIGTFSPFSLFLVSLCNICIATYGFLQFLLFCNHKHHFL